MSLGFLDILRPRYFKLFVAILKGRLLIKFESILLVTARNSLFCQFTEYPENLPNVSNKFSRGGTDRSGLRRYKIMSSA